MLFIAGAFWARRGGASQANFQFLKQLKSFAKASVRGKLKELLRLSTVFRLKMQTALAHAELRRSLNNVELRQAAASKSAAVRKVVSGTAIRHVTAISQLILALAAPPIVTKGLVLTTTLAGLV